MKLALILFGISYAECIQHWTGNNFKVDYKESLKNYKEYIWKYFNKYNIDVFFSSYKSEKSQNLIKDYNPKSYHFFPPLNYIKKFKRAGKNSNIIKAIELTLEYSKKKNIRYDVCILTRFDLLFQIPFEKTALNLNMFNNTSELEKHSRICDNFYVMPGHMLEKFYSIIKSYGISANHHFLKYRLLKVFKINYIHNEHTHISALNFYKILRIPADKKSNMQINNDNKIIENNTILSIPNKLNKNLKMIKIKKINPKKKEITKLNKILLKNLVKRNNKINTNLKKIIIKK